MIPQGQANRAFTCCLTQFEEWPEEVKKVFDYDPEGAEALLDEDGHRRGADGIRFKTALMWLDLRPLSYAELFASYWKRIGVDVEIQVEPLASFAARRSERDFEMISAEAAGRWFPMVLVQRFTPAASWNSSNVNDPWYNAKFEAGVSWCSLSKRETTRWSPESTCFSPPGWCCSISSST